MLPPSCCPAAPPGGSSSASSAGSPTSSRRSAPPGDDTPHAAAGGPRDTSSRRQPSSCSAGVGCCCCAAGGGARLSSQVSATHCELLPPRRATPAMLLSDATTQHTLPATPAAAGAGQSAAAAASVPPGPPHSHPPAPPLSTPLAPVLLLRQAASRLKGRTLTAGGRGRRGNSGGEQAQVSLPPPGCGASSTRSPRPLDTNSSCPGCVAVAPGGSATTAAEQCRHASVATPSCWSGTGAGTTAGEQAGSSASSATTPCGCSVLCCQLQLLSAAATTCNAGEAWRRAAAGRAQHL